ncbi:hypothetical protein [Terriglobus sp.]|uniref:hypothetical protein n=1 Tax=Terriglobus sp. TaxID=1889013 RepID=UPI003B002208
MLDVHAPEHTPHSLRDFFLHIFTITIGLLIALGLEAAVEWQHHVHLRHEADENILSEIRDNQREIAEVLGKIPGERQTLSTALAFLKAHAAGKDLDVKSINLGMNFGSYWDASWQTANATGALGYMEYAHVKRYSGVYTLQGQFTQIQTQTLSAYLQIQSYVVAGEDPRQLSMADTQKANAEVRQTLTDLLAMEEVGQALQKQYELVLKAE